MSSEEYWQEAFECAFDALGLFEIVEKLTPEQLKDIGKSLCTSCEMESMAHYSPPSSDRINSIESEWKAKYAALQKELDGYQRNAEEAVKRAYKLPSYADISIRENGHVERIA